MKLNEDFWTSRYQSGEIGWDIGYPSTPIKEYVNQLDNKDLDILIPGAGNAHEAEYLWSIGFKNVSVLDISPEPLNNLQLRIPAFPSDQLIHTDFFDFTGQFDLILEQTFFCALLPQFRSRYVDQMERLLVPGGKLAGLLFDDPMYDHRPPFGGSKETYMKLFSKKFKILTMASAYNSIPQRSGTEVFMICQKADHPN